MNSPTTLSAASTSTHTPAVLPVFYRPEMVARTESFSPSAAKPEATVASWQRGGLSIRILSPEPVTVAQYSLAHSPRHVAAILAGKADNGFNNRSPEVAAALPYTTGALLSAARHVLVHGGFAAAPCSGMHHARYSSVGGYCTFNGLMVTACVLRAEGLVSRVGILDFDMHYGDGTDEIITRLKARDWVRHFTAGRYYDDEEQAQEFLARIPEIARSMRDCDVVLYQAGADPHVDDPLGGWLTTEQLRLRDAAVFAAFHELGVPVVWNLAGGYQVERDGSIPKLLEIHDNTAVECLRALDAGRVRLAKSA